MENEVCQTKNSKKRFCADWKKIVSLVGAILGMCGVLFSLIFVLLIEVETVTKTSIVGALNGVSTTGARNLFYYLGEAYLEVGESLDALISYDSNFEVANYYPLIIGTLIVAATIVTVITFSVLATVRFVKKVTGKSENEYGKFVAATVLSYIAGAVAFFAIHAMSYETAESGMMTAKTAVTFNGATKAGVVLTAVCFGAYLLCNVVVNFKTMMAEKRLVSFFLNAVGILFFSLALTYVAGGIAHADIPIPSLVQGGYSSNTNGGYYLLNFIVMRGGNDIENAKAVYLPMMGQFIQVGLIVTLSAAIAVLATRLTSGKGDLALSVVSAVLAIAHLALAVSSCMVIAEEYHVEGAFMMRYTQTVTAFAFVIFAMVITIAGYVVSKRIKRAAAKEASVLPQDTAETVASKTEE
ncbi:MAG: hypothetical protein K2J30_01570 [Clostridia bacterium]|nr:hypothetical protein [Clostridia bacterium]